MTEANVKSMILVSALEAEVQGMIAANKDREQQGEVMAYWYDNFADTAGQMRSIAAAHDDDILFNY